MYLTLEKWAHFSLLYLGWVQEYDLPQSFHKEEKDH